MQNAATIDRLRELLVALDQRPVHLDRPAEAAIAKDALEMRDKAVARLAELESNTPTDA